MDKSQMEESQPIRPANVSQPTTPKKTTLLSMPDELLLDILERAAFSGIEEALNPPPLPPRRNTSKRSSLNSIYGRAANFTSVYEVMDQILDCADETAITDQGSHIDNELKRFLGVNKHLFEINKGLLQKEVLGEKTSRTLTIALSRINCCYRPHLLVRGDFATTAIVYNTTTQLRLRLSAACWQYPYKSARKVVQVASEVLLKCCAVEVLTVELNADSPSDWQAYARQAIIATTSQMEAAFGHTVNLQITSTLRTDG